MLSNTAFSGAYPLAHLLAKNGQTLSVVGGTPLEHLTEASLPCPLEVEGVDVEVLPPKEAIIEAVSAESYPGINDHQCSLMSVVDAASAIVHGQLDLARNTVLPEVREITDAVLAYAESRRGDRMVPLTIKTQFMDEVFRSGELRDQIAGFGASMLRNVEPARLTATWNETALKTGMGLFDQLVSRYFQAKEADARDIWERYFAAVPGKYRAQNLAEELDTRDKQLVVYLGANRLLADDTIPEGLEMGLQEYRSYLARLREQAGALLHYRLKTDDAVRNAKQLVLTAPKRKSPGERPSGEIAVNGEVYNQWLSEGGSPEALYGAVLVDGDLSYAGSLAKAADYATEWSRAASILETEARFRYQADLIAGMREALINKARSKLADPSANLPTVFYTILDERLKHFHLKDVDQLYIVVRKAVCRLFYPESDAEKILNAFDAVAEKNGNLDPREVALLVLIDYVADWVSGFIVTPRAA